jgi:TPR repeat protein
MRLKRTLSTSLFFLFLLLWPALAHADFQAGLDAYKRGDYAIALNNWLPLAEQGDASAQYLLGLLYHDGKGVPQDYAQARDWYRKAAEQGNASAQVNLGTLYYHDQGVPQDYTQARKWWLKAAEQGDAGVQASLGFLYSLGKGVPQDYVQAHMWYNLAAAKNVNWAIKFRGALARGMTSEQIAEAQRLAREWLAQHQK